MFKSMLKVRLFYVLLIIGAFQPNITLADCGAFTQVPNSPFDAESGPSSVAYSPVVNGNLFAAVANTTSGNVSVYSVDNESGVFTQLTNSPFAAKTGAFSVAYSSEINGKLFAAVANFGSNDVSVYSVDTSSGEFIELPTSPVAAQNGPISIAYSPVVNGRLFAAVANFTSNNVSVYTVNTLSGAFTPVAGSPFTAGTNSRSVAYSPVINGNLFAAVTNDGGGVSVYSVDTSSGAFTPVAGSPFAAGTNPQSVAYSPVINGQLFAAVANLNSDNVSVYSVDPSTGALVELSDSPFTAGMNARFVAYSPVINGQLFAAVANRTSDNVSVYSVDPSTGAFVELSASPFLTGMNPRSVAYSPIVNGNLFAAVANFASDNVSVYSVDTAVPAATLSVAPEVIAQGNSATLTATLTGTAPFTITYSDGFVQDGDSPLERVVSPSSTTDYQIVSVSDSGDHCNPGGPSNTVTVTVTPASNTKKVVLCGRACRVARTGRPRICGRAKPGSQVKLFANKKCVGSAKANCRGVFCIVPRKALSKGCNSVVACVRDEGATSCSNVIRVLVKRR